MGTEDTHSDPDLEREKWRVEVDLRLREICLKEKEQERLAAEAARSRWWNPLVLAIVGGTIAAVGNAGVTWWNGKVSEQTETLKAESARIVEMIRAGDIRKARENLEFLLDTGLISGPTAGNLKQYLKRTPADRGPLLPSFSFSQPASPNTEAANISTLVCPGGDGEYLIYQYTARRPGDPTFRVILPPNWGQAIGGRDLFARQDAEKVALDACKSKR